MRPASRTIAAEGVKETPLGASTRAARPYSDRDFQLVIDTLGEAAARRVPAPRGDGSS